MKFLKKKRWWLVIALLLAVFILYERHPVDRLYDFLPPGIDLFAEIQKPYNGWEDAFANPLCAKAYGYLPKEFRNLSHYTDHAATRWLLSKTAPRYGVVACAFDDEADSKPVWIAASWLGWRAPVVRLLLGAIDTPRLQKKTSVFGATFWAFHDGRLPSGTHVEFTVIDGVLLGCLTERENALSELIALRKNGDDSFVRFLPDTGEPVRAWVNIDSVRQDAASWLPKVLMEVTAVNSTSLAGRISSSSDLIDHDSVYEELNISLLNVLMGDDAMGMFAAKMDTLGLGVRLAQGDAAARVFSELFIEYGAEAMVGMFSDAETPRATLPSWIVCVKSKLPSKIISDFPEFLTLLNHKFQFPRLSRIIQTKPGDGQPSASGRVYYSMGDEAGASIAYTEYEDYVLIASDRKLLESRLDRLGSSRGRLRNVTWRDRMSSHPSPFYGWINEAKPVDRQLKENSKSDFIADAWSWMQTFRLMGESHVWATATNGQTVIRFDVGH